MIFPAYWQEQLRQAMLSRQANCEPPRVAIVGVGHELCGDDAAGILVVRRLGEMPRDPRFLVVEAGAAPENCSGLIGRHRPDLVLFIDAADMAAAPGTIAWLPWQDMDGYNVSTHTMSLRLLSAYLIARLGCQVALLGIQPATVAMTVKAALSPAVARAVEAAVQMLENQIGAREGVAVL